MVGDFESVDRQALIAITQILDRRNQVLGIGIACENDAIAFVLQQQGNAASVWLAGIRTIRSVSKVLEIMLAR